MVDRVEISIIEEDQPRWLPSSTARPTSSSACTYEFINHAMPNGKVAPNLAKRGIRGYRQVEPRATPSSSSTWTSPMVGGYTPADVALRRAIGLGMDSAEAISCARARRRRETPLIPFTTGFEPV